MGYSSKLLEECLKLRADPNWNGEENLSPHRAWWEGGSLEVPGSGSYFPLV